MKDLIKRDFVYPEVRKLRSDFDRVFRNFWSAPLWSQGLLREPLMDIVEDRNKIEASLELPGMVKSDVKVTVKDNVIQIKAEKKEKKVEEGKRYYRQERSYRGFYKSFTVPSVVDTKKIKTHFDKGILTLTLPKKKA